LHDANWIKRTAVYLSNIPYVYTAKPKFKLTKYSRFGHYLAKLNDDDYMNWITSWIQFSILEFSIEFGIFVLYVFSNWDTMQEALQVLDTIRLNFSPGGLLILNIIIGLLMFGVALEMRIKRFRQVLRKPKSILVGVFSQFILLPLATFLLVLLIKPSPAVALGMILVASCPGGNVSNFISSLAKGNIELSVSLTAIATILAVFMTPINFALYGQWYVDFYNQINASTMLRPINIDIWQVFQTVFILLGIPIILGLIIHYRFPRTTYKSLKYVIVIIMIANNLEYFLKYVHLVFLIVLVHNALALITGFSMASIFRLPKTNKRSITIETGIQNSGLALALIFNPKIFPTDLELGGMTFIAAFWGIWHILSGLFIAGFFRRKDLRAKHTVSLSGNTES
jgi:BASS family bile acid:Na+ symporter